ncbi:transporter substrate-binding domain-containing protein [Treponema zioleckii]|uniref:transporter substrate-binding domain-containing protein n=1 Tax=Treponema zioleckii TaxID=331680 RepID=UPI00168AA7CE|nr:transporter substrate-binding domain-containing protein [Treponema zioleckii]
MKKTLVKFLCASLMVLSASSAFAAKSDLNKIKKAGVLKVGCKEDVPGYGYLNPATNQHEGLEIEIAKAVSKKIFGKESVKFTGVTAKTRGPLVDTGEIDMVAATFTVTDERRKLWDFSTIYMQDPIAIMVKKASGFNSFKDLNGKTVGVSQASTTKKTLTAEAKKAGITLKFNDYATYAEIKSALDSGRIDAFSVDSSILAGYMEDSVMLMSERYSPQNYGIAVKKGNKELLAVINATIDEMEKSGEMAKIKAKFNLDK